MAQHRHTGVSRDTLTDDGLRSLGRHCRRWGLKLLPLAGLLLLLATAGHHGGSGVSSAFLPLPVSSIERDLNGLLSAIGGSRRLVLVADVSASMSDPPPGDEASQSKWDVVRAGVAGFLQTLPTDTVVGVRVFGQTAAAHCAASELVRELTPLGPGGAEDITGKLDRLTPAGDTPLVDTIKAAADDLGASGGEIIVLSDGMDTCAGMNDLCSTARAIGARGTLVRIDIVETFMAEDAKRAIACAPEATGGVAVNFLGDDAAALGAVLRRLVPLRLLAAILLIVFGGVTFFALGDLLAGALGAVLWRGTAGFVADVAFAIIASLWAAFWLSRLTHFPFAVAAILAVALVVVLCRQIPRRRSQTGGWS